MELHKRSDAIKQMRQLSEAGVPFSFSFLSYSRTKDQSNGFKFVAKAILRKGYRKNQSDLADDIIAYTDLTTKQDRQFNECLLLSFNNHKLKP